MDAAVMILFGCAVIAFAALTYAIVQKLTAKDDIPQADQVRQAIKLYVNRAINAGEHLALEGIENEEKVLSSLDRKAIADKFYDLLPDTLWIFGIPIPLSLIKAEVTRDEFERLVENEYNESIAFIEKHKATLKAQVGKYVATPEPPPPTFTLEDAFNMIRQAASSNLTIKNAYSGGTLKTASSSITPSAGSFITGSSATATIDMTNLPPSVPPADPQPTPEQPSPSNPPADSGAVIRASLPSVPTEDAQNPNEQLVPTSAG